MPLYKIAQNEDDKNMTNLLLCHGRFDGTFGFPGGVIDSGEDLVSGVNRELAEEIGDETPKVIFTTVIVFYLLFIHYILYYIIHIYIYIYIHTFLYIYLYIIFTAVIILSFYFIFSLVL